MRDRVWIVGGLAVFAVALTAPFWCAHLGTKNLARMPNLALPANQTQCVAPVEYMRASHMVLLLRWREEVVRLGQRRYVAFNGKVYDKSLTRTCLDCHNKEQFCDRCHSYAGVSGPYCWNCHNQPQTHVAGTSLPPMQPEAAAPHLAFTSPSRFPAQAPHPQSLSFPRSMP